VVCLDFLESAVNVIRKQIGEVEAEELLSPAAWEASVRLRRACLVTDGGTWRKLHPPSHRSIDRIAEITGAQGHRGPGSSVPNPSIPISS
jgi:hypothetical protein